MRLVALLIFLCSCAYATAEVEDASSFNLALAPSLLGAKNACNAPARAISADDIFSVAEARIVSLVPQVGNVTSDLTNSSLLWSWSAGFANETNFSVRQDPRCPDGAIRYFSPSSPLFSGRLSYTYGNATETVGLPPFGKNPMPLNLSHDKLLPENYSSLFAPLSVSLDATISVSFRYVKSFYSYGCTSFSNGYAGCGCSLGSEAGTRIFQKNVSHARNFSVETGPVSVLWINPPLSSRLEGAGIGKVAFFSRRMPANITFSFAGERLGSVQPYFFSTHTGQCGEKIVEREFLPGKGGVFLNKSEPLLPYQLVEKNASYLPFYAAFPWDADAGNAEFEIIFEDAFSHNQRFLRNFSVRRPTEVSLRADDDGLAKNSPGTPPPPLEQGSAMKQFPATKDGTAAAYMASQPVAPFPDFPMLAAAAALPLAICALFVCRKLEWL